MELVEIYEGQTVLAEALFEELRRKRIGALRRFVAPMAGILIDRPPYQSVLISERDWQERRAAVEECLLFVSGNEGK